MRLDASSPGLDRAEEMAERVDAYRTAQTLIKEYDWGAHPPEPADVLELARFLAGLPE